MTSPKGDGVLCHHYGRANSFQSGHAACLIGQLVSRTPGSNRKQAFGECLKTKRRKWAIVAMGNVPRLWGRPYFRSAHRTHKALFGLLSLQ